MELLQVAIHALHDSAASRRDLNLQIISQLALKFHLAKDDGKLEVRVREIRLFVEHVFGLLDLSGSGKCGKGGRGGGQVVRGDKLFIKICAKKDRLPR
jgi:hypothetical protein